MPHIAFLLSILAFQAPQASQAIGGAGGDMGVIKYIDLLHRSNLDEFKRGRVVYELLRDMSATADVDVEDFKGAFKAEGLLIFDDVNARLEWVFADRGVLAGARRIDEKRMAVELMSMKLLTNGKSTLVDFLSPTAEVDRVDDRVEIFAEDNGSVFGSHAIFVYPVGPRGIIRDRFSNDLGAVLNGDRELVGLRVENEPPGDRRAVLSIAGPNKSRQEYVVDLIRGAIPLEARIFTPDGKLMTERILGDVRKVQGAGWFPFLLRINLGDAGARVIKVFEVDFDHKPRDSEFNVAFRRPTSFTDRVASSYVRKVNSYSLIGRGTRPEKRGVKVVLGTGSSSLAGTDLQGELPAPTVWPTVLIVVCALLVIAIAVVGWRRVQRARA